MGKDTKFKKGNPGKLAGSEMKSTKKAKELFLDIMEGEVDHIQIALKDVREFDSAKYLDVLSKLFPYFMPKRVDISNEDKSFAAPQIILNGSNRVK